MKRPLLLSDRDVDRIDYLRKRLRLRSDVGVVRRALGLLESNLDKAERDQRWEAAVKLVRGESRRTLRQFQRHSRLTRLER